MVIFTKFHKDWTEYVDILLIANFWMCFNFFPSDFRIYCNQIFAKESNKNTLMSGIPGKTSYSWLNPDLSDWKLKYFFMTKPSVSKTALLFLALSKFWSDTPLFLSYQKISRLFQNLTCMSGQIFFPWKSSQSQKWTVFWLEKG